MVERSLGVRETPGSIPGSPIPSFNIALLYSYSPSGHSHASIALQEALADIVPSAKAFPLELTADLHPMFGPVLSKAYFEVVQKTPKLWDYLYDNNFVAQALKEFRELLSLWHRRTLRERLEAIRPDLIVCAQALPCATLAIEKETGRLKTPLVAVLTDFGVHAYWISDQVDLYLVPNEEVRLELIHRGIAPSAIAVTGIPISKRFKTPLPKGVARQMIGLHQDKPTIMVSGGTKGIGPMRDIISRLTREFSEIQIIAVCGENRKLYDHLQKKYESLTLPSPVTRERGSINFKKPRVRVLSFTDNIETCLAASDLLVGKAGGLTVSEALAINVPMIILDPLPGQEERNTAYLISNHAAVRAEDLDEFVSTASRLLASPDRLTAMRRAAAAVSRPQAAEAAVQEMVRRFLLSFRRP